MTAMNPLLVGLQLRDPEGVPVAFADFAGPLLVVQLVRYFGCLPCQEWLVSLDAAGKELAQFGARPLAVGGSADYQARYLQEQRGVTMPLLLDGNQEFRDVVGIGDLGVRLLDPRGLVSYGRALAAGFRPQRVTRDTVRAPGVVILDQNLAVRWSFEGSRIGDYPELSEVLTATARLAAE